MKPGHGNEARQILAQANREGRVLPASGQGADLSPEAIQARRESTLRGGGDSGLTGQQMGLRASRVLDAATKARAVADRRPHGSRKAAALRTAEEALVTASVQVRIAQRTPLDKGYLHHLTIQQIQAMKAEVAKIAQVDIAALAIDAHRRVQQELQRHKGTPTTEGIIE